MNPVGVVDIGTNSMRLLITDGSGPGKRWVEITGLGHGIDASGQLSEDAMERSIHVLEDFSRIMTEDGVERRSALATSAVRDAANGDAFLDWAEMALGIRPELVSGEREGGLAYAGARLGLEIAGPIAVCDIGGGSTEIVSEDSVASVDVGSVRLTDHLLPDRPPSGGQVDDAFDHVESILSELSVDEVGTLIGVAGTWTSLGAVTRGIADEDPSLIHGMILDSEHLEGLFDHLLGLTGEETAALPGLDPRRAPVILSGALIAVVVMRILGVTEAVISERDTLDGMAAELLALP